MRIVALEDDERDGPIVHVLLADLRLRTPWGPNEFQDFLYSPVAERAFRASTIEVAATGEDTSRADEGLAAWRAARRQGRAGIWSIPLGEVVASMEEAIQRAGPPSRA